MTRYCSWCWRPLGWATFMEQGRPYCSHQCARHDPRVELDPGIGNIVPVVSGEAAQVPGGG